MQQFSFADIGLLLRATLSSSFRRSTRLVSGYKTPRYELGVETPIQTFYDGRLFDPLGMRARLTPIKGVPPYGLPSPTCDLRLLTDFRGGLKFRVNPNQSFFGDCINVVDAPNEKPLDNRFPPFGWSAPSLVGGHAITASALTGEIEVQFSESRDGYAEISFDHGPGLRGSDSILAAPSGYGLMVSDNRLRDVVPRSRGSLELLSGRIHDFHYNVEFSNSAIRALCEANTGLVPPPLLFPGLPHAGHTMGWFFLDDATRDLTLCIVAQQFLPLGPNVNGIPLRLPPSQTGAGASSPFRASNSALHPFVFIKAVAHRTQFASGATRNPPASRESYRNKPRLVGKLSRRSLAQYENRVVNLKCVPGSTDFGDNFALQSEVLGGAALARSPLFGSVQIQFGCVVGGKIPFTIKLVSPSRQLHSKSARLLSLLPPGTEAGLIGMHGQLRFPNRTYSQRDLSLTTDPYKVSVGIADVGSGQFENAVLRKYLFQNVMQMLLLVEPRTPTDSFCYVCDGQFQNTNDGLLLHLYGDFTIPYPSGYRFPLPDGGKTTIGPGSHLLPFLNIAALEEGAFARTASQIRFHASAHSRGEFGPDARFSIGAETSEGRMVHLTHGSTVAIGDLSSMNVATIGDTRVWEVEFAMRKTSRRSRTEHCYAMLVLQDGAPCSLLITSEHETYDTWLEGTLASG